MAPIEVVFGIVVFVFALIGLGRGFLREMGATTVLVLVLFFLSRFDGYLDRGMLKGITLIDSTVTTEQARQVQCWVLLFIIVGVTFLSYHGETLAFPGHLNEGVQSVLLGLLGGTLNGYLVAGSIWYYMDKFGYPIRWLGFAPEQFSDAAHTAIQYLPLNFLGQPAVLGESLLLYLSVFLILVRVIR
ncbi:MAG: hypothetical protein GX657_01160 [Chloroflexi bacterium]|nr:hypothetical protein [Chloroflexota bacterium]